MAKTTVKALVTIFALVLILTMGWQCFYPSQSDRHDLAIIFNQADPLSVRVANYYKEQRGIATENLIGVNFNPNGSELALAEFTKLATGSYGTVVEPCNFIQKFLNPGILMFDYLRGDRLIEAYWKSVEQPGQGIFIGEPLASPFKLKN